MRLLLVEEAIPTRYVNLLTVGNWYDGELTPTMYDPNTLQPADPYYVVKCNDDRFRKVEAKYFITLDEVRDNKLNDILDGRQS